jgi:hypothetical protein
MVALSANVPNVQSPTAFCTAKTDSSKMLTVAIFVNVTNVLSLHVQWHVNTADLRKMQMAAISVNVKLVFLSSVFYVVITASRKTLTAVKYANAKHVPR